MDLQTLITTRSPRSVASLLASLTKWEQGAILHEIEQAYYRGPLHERAATAAMCLGMQFDAISAEELAALAANPARFCERMVLDGADLRLQDDVLVVSNVRSWSLVALAMRPETVLLEDLANRLVVVKLRWL